MDVIKALNHPDRLTMVKQRETLEQVEDNYYMARGQFRSMNVNDLLWQLKGREAFNDAREIKRKAKEYWLRRLEREWVVYGKLIKERY